MRKLIFYRNYFLEFYNQQSIDVQEKIEWTLGLVRDLTRIPEKYFKHIEGTDGIYEIRVQVGTNIYRVFSFFDEGSLVILVNGFQKKTQKTPKKEIKLATQLMKEYYNEKRNNY